MKTSLISLLCCLLLASCSSSEFIKIESERFGNKEPDQSKNQETKNPKADKEATKSVDTKAVKKVTQNKHLRSDCLEQMARLPNPLSNEHTFRLCDKLKLEPSCKSVNDKPIFHYDKESAKDRHIKVLVLGTIHGDEPASGSLARDWIHRLEDLEPRSRWRILPVTNPDGLFKKTRVNANGVDVNRNFPTDDWLDKAQEHWRTRSKSSPRRFPGNLGGSEPETKCITKHIKDFKPDFIISVHTPYGVLDFDGPNVIKPKSILPWRRLGHMPGSLGRFMWKDERVPVLTIELRGNAPLKGKEMEDLQDIIGTVAIRSLKSLGRW